MVANTDFEEEEVVIYAHTIGIALVLVADVVAKSRHLREYSFFCKTGRIWRVSMLFCAVPCDMCPSHNVSRVY